MAAPLDAVKKPVYDARQRYIELLMKRLEIAGDHLDAGDLHSCCVQLQLVHSMVTPWILDVDARRIGAQLQRLEHVLPAINTARTTGYAWQRDQQRIAKSQAERLLIKATTELTTSSKHLMLPADVGITDDDIDMEKWLREAGS